MKAVLIALTAGLALSGCTTIPYVYDYDPYAGPRGYYAGPLEWTPSRTPSWQNCTVVESGPYYGGWRGPYYAGPYCAPQAEAASGGGP